jgi:hypothetical protein
MCSLLTIARSRAVERPRPLLLRPVQPALVLRLRERLPQVVHVPLLRGQLYLRPLRMRVRRVQGQSRYVSWPPLRPT